MARPFSAASDGVRYGYNKNSLLCPIRTKADKEADRSGTIPLEIGTPSESILTRDRGLMTPLCVSPSTQSREHWICNPSDALPNRQRNRFCQAIVRYVYNTT